MHEGLGVDYEEHVGDSADIDDDVQMVLENLRMR